MHVSISVLAVGAGGAIGAISRYLITRKFLLIYGDYFPLGTLFVNILGSLLIGMSFEYFITRSSLPEEGRLLLTAGFLGAFTTFSAFSLEAVHMIQKEEVIKALTYVTSSVTLCILAAYLGIVIIRQF